jgi:putative Holliday junction resolvase
MPEAWRLLLAFDFGLKRIGVATANRLTQTASPLMTLAADNGPPWADIGSLIAEWQPDLVVVGEPGPDADDALRKALDAFVAALAARYSIPIEAVDERYTSAAAESALRAERRKGIYNRRLSRGQVDQRAACLIAEQWMSQALD